MAKKVVKNIAKKDIAEAIAEKYGFTKKDAANAVNDVFELISATVEKGGEVSINGFGKFVSVRRSARKAKNPLTGEEIKVKAHNVPQFKASKTLKDRVK